MCHITIIGPRIYSGLKETDGEDDDSPPYFDDYDSSGKEEYMSDIEDQNDAIQNEFNVLVASTFDSLRERNIHILTIILFFQQFISTFDPEDANELAKAKQIHHIHKIVNKYFSFCDYDLIKELIKQFGTNEDKLRIEKYSKAYSNFVLILYRNRVRLEPHFKAKNEIILKLDLDHDKLPPKRLDKIKKRIATVLKVRRSFLVLKEIAKGCLELEYLVPAFVWQRLLELSGETKMKMFKESITFIEFCTSDKIVSFYMCIDWLPWTHYTHRNMVPKMKSS